MKWLLLPIGLAVLFWLSRQWRLLRHRHQLADPVSQHWLDDDTRRRRALGWDGVPFTGPFHDPLRDSVRWTERKR